MTTGYDKGGALTMLDDFGFYPGDGVFMKTQADFLQTKYEKEYAADGDAMYTLGNSRANMNILVKFEE